MNGPHQKQPHPLHSRPVRLHSLQLPPSPHQVVTVIVFLLNFVLCGTTIALSNNDSILVNFLTLLVFLLGLCVVMASLLISLRDSQGFSSQFAKLEQMTCRCTICVRQISLSTKHCGVCNKCVVGFDHHCVWLNTCVGVANYRLFFVIINNQFLLCLAKLFLSFSVLYFEARPLRTKYVLLGVTLTQIVIDALMMVALGDLIVFHLYLKRKGITTYQHIQSKRAKKKAKQESQGKQRQAEQTIIQDFNENTSGLNSPSAGKKKKNKSDQKTILKKSTFSSQTPTNSRQKDDLTSSNIEGDMLKTNISKFQLNGTNTTKSQRGNIKKSISGQSIQLNTLNDEEQLKEQMQFI